MTVIGIDIGSQKTMMCADNADILLTDTGSLSRPSLVAFMGRSRLVGEEAAPQIAGDSTIALLNLIIGTTKYQESLSPHTRVALSSSSRGLSAEVSYCDKKEVFSATSLLAIFIGKLYSRAISVHGSNISLTFALPPSYSLSVARAYTEACAIADIDTSRVAFVDATDCLVSTYTRKLQALRGSEKTNLEVIYMSIISFD